MKAVFCLLLLCSACVFGQRRVDVDNDVMTLQSGSFFQAVNGVPVATNVYYKVVDGSAFFYPEWSKGTAVFGSKRYANLMMKLDLLKNELHFKDDKGEEMICSSPIHRIVFGDSALGNLTAFVHTSFIPGLAPLKPEAWVQARAEGRVSLYTQYKKNISEVRPYGSATLEQRISTAEVHYLVQNDQFIRVKKLADVLNALADKKAALQQWIKANNIDGRSAADLGRVVDAYNKMPSNP